MVSDIANQQSIPTAIDDDAVWLTKVCTSRRSAVSRESRLASARYCRNQPCLRLDLSHHMIVAFRDIEVAGRIKLYFMRHVQRRLGRYSTVARVRPLSVTGDGRR